MISSLRRVLLLSGKELRSLGADPMLLAFIVYIFSVAIYQIATGVKVEVEQRATSRHDSAASRARLVA